MALKALWKEKIEEKIENFVDNLKLLFTANCKLHYLYNGIFKKYAFIKFLARSK